MSPGTDPTRWRLALPLAAAVTGVAMHAAWEAVFGRLDSAAVRQLSAAAFAIAVVIAHQVTRPSEPKTRRWRAVRAAGVVVMLAGVVRIATASLPSSDERSALESQGERVVRDLEAFRTKYNRYPCFDASEALELPVSAFGPWRYSTTTDCGTFNLSVGDYRDDGFSLGWSSDRPSWYWDT